MTEIYYHAIIHLEIVCLSGLFSRTENLNGSRSKVRGNER